MFKVEQGSEMYDMQAHEAMISYQRVQTREDENMFGRFSTMRNHTCEMDCG